MGITVNSDIHMMMVVVVMVVVDDMEWLGIAVRVGSCSSSRSMSCPSCLVSASASVAYGTEMPSIIASVEIRILMHACPTELY